MINQRQIISLFRTPATRPPARDRVAAFVELDEVLAALDALAAKRGETRAEWLAVVRSPRERAGQR